MTLTVTVYYIWQVRNRNVFEGVSFVSKDVTHRICTHVYKVMFKLYSQILDIGVVSLIV